MSEGRPPQDGSKSPETRSDTSGDYIPTLPVPVGVPSSTWTNLQEGTPAPVGGGTVTSITFAAPLTGGVITVSGTVGLGNVPPTNLNSGIGATATTFWRGDGTWAATGANPAGSTGQVQYNASATTFGGSGGMTLNASAVASMTMGLGADAQGDLYFRNAAGLMARLAVGTAGQILGVASGLPAWQTVGTGGGTVNPGNGGQIAQYAAGTGVTVVAGVTVSGDATIAAGGALTLTSVNGNVGTFQGITVNAKGLVTAAAAQSYLTANQTVTLSGDVAGAGATAITATLATVNANVGSFQGLTVNAKGLVTAAVNQNYAPLANAPAPGANGSVLASNGTVAAYTRDPRQFNTVGINQNTQAIPAAGAGEMMRLSGVDATAPYTLFNGYGLNSSPSHSMQYARGTAALPTAVQSGDLLGSISWDARGATTYSFNGAATIGGYATQTWTDAAHGTAVGISTVAAGALAPILRAQFAQGLLVNTSAGAAPAGGDMGAGTLNVAGGLYVNGVAAVPAAPGANGSVLGSNGTVAAYTLNPGPLNTVTLGPAGTAMATPPARLYMTGAANEPASINLDTYGLSAGSVAIPTLWLTAARGTVATPTAIQLNDVIGRMAAGGNPGWNLSGALDITAAETFTATAHGTRVDFKTATLGTAVLQTRATLQAGLQINTSAGVAPTGGDQGAGTINTAGEHYVNGVSARQRGATVSWLAGANPNGGILLVADRAMTITLITGIPEVLAGAAAACTLYKAPSGTALSAGTAVTTVGAFNANVGAGTYQNIGISVANLAAGDRLGIVSTGAWTASVGSISVTVV